jgi:hypothetical protein
LTLPASVTSRLLTSVARASSPGSVERRMPPMASRRRSAAPRHGSEVIAKA